MPRHVLAAVPVSQRVQMPPRLCSPAPRFRHLNLLPQGQPEKERRALSMVAQMNAEMFGNCTNIGECEAVCPKLIRLEVIARMNRDYLKASWSKRNEALKND